MCALLGGKGVDFTGVDPVVVQQVSAAVVPFVVEGAKSLGERLWSRAEDAAVDGAAGWGRAFLAQIWGDRESAPPVVAAAVDEVMAAPDDEDAQETLLVQVRRALKTSPELLAEVASLVERAQGDSSVSGPVTNSRVSTGSRAVGDVDNGWAIAGDNNTVNEPRRP